MKSQLQKIKLLLTCLLLCLSTGAAQAEYFCAKVQSSPSYNLSPQTGRDIGPFEWLYNLKLKVWGSKSIRQFNVEKYEESFRELSQMESQQIADFVPRSKEEFVALLDVKLADLNISIQKLDPIYRQKIYHLVGKLIDSDEHKGRFSTKSLAEVLFRGSHQKPTSFAFLLTHTPKETSSEMLKQHLQILIVTDIVVGALRPESWEIGPYVPNPMERILPSILREHHQILWSGFILGLSILQSIQSQDFVVFLSAFNIFELKRQTEMIQKEMSENPPVVAAQILQDQLAEGAFKQFAYSVIRKSLNWYALISIFAPFFFN